MLVLVRHGRTELNATGRLQGRFDAPLDGVGEAQAAAVADRLGRSPAQVVASPLLRAGQTAAAIAAASGAPTRRDGRWIELDYGELEGLAVADIPASTWARWRSDPDFTPPGGESMATVWARVVEACEALRGAAAEGDVVVVSHVTPIKMAVGWALGGDVTTSIGWRTRVDPASITRIAVGAAGPVLVTFNETAHLAR